MNEYNIDSVLSHFRLFLERSFDHIESIYNGNKNEEDLQDAWLQANWELLVERVVCNPSEFLTEYGAGADLYDVSSRVFLPDAIPTHNITVHSKYGRKVVNLLDNKLIELDDPELDLDFHSFCYSHGGFYYPFQAPLNSVLLTGKNDPVTISLTCVTFKKTPIKNK